MAGLGEYLKCKFCGATYRESAIKSRRGFCRCGGQIWIDTRPTWLDKLRCKLMGR